MTEQTTTAPDLGKKAYSLQTAAKVTDTSVTTLRDAITANELVAQRVGKSKSKLLILATELDRWLESLPTKD